MKLFGKIPNPKKPEHWSATEFIALETCEMQAAYSHDLELRRLLRKPNEFTAMGNVVDSLVKSVTSGEFDQTPLSQIKDSLLERWDELALSQYESLCQSWAPSRPANPELWPGWNTKRSETISAQKYRIESRMGYRETPGPNVAQMLQLGSRNIGKELSDSSIGLIGIPDRLIFKENSVDVIDIKSSVEENEIRDSYRIQLLLYAHLVQIEYKRPVHKIGVEFASGRLITEEIIEDDIFNAIENFVKLTQRFSELADSGRFGLARANPSIENCQYCVYKITCPSYWATEVSQSLKTTALGEVIATRGRSIMLQEVVQGSLQEATLSIIEVPTEGLRPGMMVGISSLRKSGSGYRGNWKSQVCVLDPI